MKLPPSFLLSLSFIIVIALPDRVHAQDADHFQVIGYFGAGEKEIAGYHVGELTHICYSFLHLKGDTLALRSPADSVNIAYLVSLKRVYPRLKIILSVGGWGGCSNCSAAFSRAEGREAFARSALGILKMLGADGLDLDWEFPAIQGYPGHPYALADRHDFTLLIQELRRVFADRYEISFAAGGFSESLDSSYEWKDIMPLVDRAQLMTYDLVNGFSTVTGHLTPLYSTPQQVESTDHAVRFLDSLNVPRRKVIIGSAFYARVWEDVADQNHGLYQPGKYKLFIPYRKFSEFFVPGANFSRYWDSTAHAPYLYSAEEQLFATFDDSLSVSLKTEYALDNKLGGIMFWELTDDMKEGGLLDAIDRTRRARMER